MDSRSRTLRVEVLVPNPKLILLPGTYLQVSFELDRANPPLKIPAAALVFGAQGPEVAVVAEDKRVTFRPVTIARDMGDVVEIASGLSDNDLVALNVGSQVADGEKVDAHLVENIPQLSPSKHTASVPPPSTIRTAASVRP